MNEALAIRLGPFHAKGLPPLKTETLCPPPRAPDTREYRGEIGKFGGGHGGGTETRIRSAKDRGPEPLKTFDHSNETALQR